MNRDEIIKMAREANFGFMTEKPKSATHMQCGIDDLERFFHMAQAAERSNWPAEMEAMERQVNILTDELAKAVAAEREACAKVVEDYLSVGLAKEMSRIIRDRGNQ